MNDKRRNNNFTMNSFINNIDGCCQKIVDKYSETAEATKNESIRYLERLARDYIRRKTVGRGQIEKKQLIEIRSEQIQKSKGKVKNVKFNLQSQKKKPPSQKKANLMKNLERISENIEKYHSSQEQQFKLQLEFKQTENQPNLSNIQPQPHPKPLSQLFQQSLKKSKSKYPPISQSDSEYEMTDYSSNESSNQNYYEQVYKYDFQSQPLFEGLFTDMRIASQPQPEPGSATAIEHDIFKPKSQNNLVFRPSGIIHSPKKDKSLRKRAYMNNKRIPKWAEDKEQIAKLVQEQADNPKFDTNKIYGRCIVERLDTNVIFNSKEEIIRNSSAKWNKE